MTSRERRIRNNKLRRQRQLRRNLFLGLGTIIFIFTLSFGNFVITSEAQSKEEVVLYKYYTNIEVSYGETLWDIADTYFCEERYDSYNDYINEVIYLNKLCDDNITAGSYLIVPYYSTEFK